MKQILFSLLAAFISAAPCSAQIARTTVQQGEIEGIVHDDYVLYPAIPYAEAPVGNLRWKSPVPKKAWEGVYKRDTYCPKPPQANEKNCSEDCLYLLVQTPAKSKSERLPVFVNIHGGGFNSNTYQGTMDPFVKNGIIYCSVEYRLGVLGFMAHPELAKESPDGISGNYGIQDQQMALRWIHDNIAAFGGDPDNITICGESAGGISVSIHCASPLAKGLFQRAISESGGSFWPVAEDRGGNTALLTDKSAEKGGIEFMKRMGAKNIKQLRKLPFDKLIEPGTPMEAFWPVVDGKYIIDDQYKLYEAGNYNDVDIIVGTNSDEGWMFSGEGPVEMYKERAKAIYGEWADRLLKLYPATTPEEVHFASADIFRDGSFAWGTYAWANLQSKSSKKNVYLYYFDQSSNNMFMKSPRGANHVAEMPFIYGWNWGPMTTTEEHMAQIMPQYWMNFIKTGNPNADGLPYWTTYKQGEETVMNIHNGFRLTTVPNQEKLDFFEDYFKAKRNK